MRVSVLGSGSGGNAIYVHAGNTRLLVDAGFSARALSARLQAIGVEADTVSGVVVTHEHGDHTCGIGVFARRHGTPLYMTDRTRAPAIDGWFTMDPVQPHLLGSRCTSCGTYFFPRQSSFCRNPDCAGTEFEDVQLSRTGRIWSSSVIRNCTSANSDPTGICGASGLSRMNPNWAACFQSMPTSSR